MNPHWVLFKGGYASALMHIQWKDKGGFHLPANSRLTDMDGSPTEIFHKLWQTQFPDRDPLPDIVSTPDGKPTKRFIEVFR